MIVDACSTNFDESGQLLQSKTWFYVSYNFRQIERIIRYIARYDLTVKTLGYFQELFFLVSNIRLTQYRKTVFSVIRMTCYRRRKVED